MMEAVFVGYLKLEVGRASGTSIFTQVNRWIVETITNALDLERIYKVTK